MKKTKETIGDQDRSPFAFPKSTTIVDKKYRRWIESQPCLICRREPCEYLSIVAHHQPERHHGAKGKKTSDYRCVSLCADHHTGGGTTAQPGSFHRMSWPFWDKYGINIEREILRLNSAYFCA